MRLGFEFIDNETKESIFDEMFCNTAMLSYGIERKGFRITPSELNEIIYGDAVLLKDNARYTVAIQKLED